MLLRLRSLSVESGKKKLEGVMRTLINAIGVLNEHIDYMYSPESEIESVEPDEEKPKPRRPQYRMTEGQVKNYIDQNIDRLMIKALKEKVQ